MYTGGMYDSECGVVRMYHGHCHTPSCIYPKETTVHGFNYVYKGRTYAGWSNMVAATSTFVANCLFTPVTRLRPLEVLSVHGWGSDLESANHIPITI